VLGSAPIDHQTRTSRASIGASAWPPTPTTTTPPIGSASSVGGLTPTSRVSGRLSASLEWEGW